MTDVESVLYKHGLRKTAFRKELLSLFHDVNSSLTAEEIKNKVGATKDKVTIYRALDSFEKGGLIHRVPDKNNLTRYALCQTECGIDEHVHNHAHFICDNCNETFCIDDVEVPKIKSSKGFTIKSSKLTLEGSCTDCISA
jgi:Fur family ferric uptake transcriptional regulator